MNLKMFRPDLARGTILIVEDDPDQLALLEYYLALMRFRTAGVSTGADARVWLEQNQTDLILLDVNLPDMDGLVLLAEVREKNPDQAVMIMSAEKRAELIVEALFEGAEEFLQKPFSLIELSTRMHNILEMVAFRRNAESLVEKLSKEREILARYFSPEIVESILKQGPASQGGEYIHTTVLVYDLRNSTGLAEELGSERFAEIINMITVDLMDLIFSNKGTITKLTGDGLIATFGTRESAEDVHNAVKCALAMREYYETILPVAMEQGVELAGFGIGLATGRAFAGNVGSFRRMEYAIVGDVLSRAGRLEALTKSLGHPILVDARTQSFVPEVPVMRRFLGRGRGKEAQLFGL